MPGSLRGIGAMSRIQADLWFDEDFRKGFQFLELWSKRASGCRRPRDMQPSVRLPPTRDTTCQRLPLGESQVENKVGER